MHGFAYCGSLVLRRPKSFPLVRHTHPRTILRANPFSSKRANIRASVGLNDVANITLDPPVEVYFCDVDGTLLNSKHDIVPRNVDAIKKLMKDTSILFIPATGRSREGALNGFGELGDILRKLYPSGVPGVYLQGLCVFNLDGSMLYESTIDPDLSRRVVDLAKRLRLDLIAYGGKGDTIFCAERNAETDKVADYHEPMPVAKGSWDKIITTETIHKFIYMAPEDRILAARPSIERELLGDSEITRACEGMLEVLPRGASKGKGVQKLLRQLDISPDAALACGDGENDVEMLELCKHSVAMENAVDVAKKVAKYRTTTNNDGGVADVIEKFILRTAVRKL